jgi:hypothetical protein
MPLSQRLDPSDANFVDVIHTNMGNLLKGDFGTPLSAGHADFYPNGGIIPCSINRNYMFTLIVYKLKLVTSFLRTSATGL